MILVNEAICIEASKSTGLRPMILLCFLAINFSIFQYSVRYCCNAFENFEIFSVFIPIRTAVPGSEQSTYLLLSFDVSSMPVSSLAIKNRHYFSLFVSSCRNKKLISKSDLAFVWGTSESSTRDRRH